MMKNLLVYTYKVAMTAFVANITIDYVTDRVIKKVNESKKNEPK